MPRQNGRGQGSVTFLRFVPDEADIRAQGLSPERWLTGTLILTGTVIAVQAICAGVIHSGLII